MPKISLKEVHCIPINRRRNGTAFIHRETNVPLTLWQIKNNTLAVPF
jgi:hypothetical protein